MTQTPIPPLTLGALSARSQADFTAQLGGIFEHSPWIPEGAWAARPFADVDELLAAMMGVLNKAGRDAQLALIKAHPELAGKEAAGGTLTASSTSEQKGAGLDQCSPDELARLRKLNAAYLERFGFPFVIAVKGFSRYQIMDAIEVRLKNTAEAEFATCLAEIAKIARLRLEAMFYMTERHPLAVEPLTREAFAPFGDVIEATGAVKYFPINDGNTERYHDLANIDPGADGRAIVSIFRGQPRRLPFEVTMMERHPRASQAFIPLSGRPYLVAVAERGDAPGVEAIRVFRCQGSQGVNYAAGVWHHPLMALENTSDFLIIDRDGPGDNCDVVQLERRGVISGS